MFPSPWELYDLGVDPGETTDLAPRMPDRVASLEAAFDRWHAQLRPAGLVDPSCR